MATALIGLGANKGANIGERRLTLSAALEMLSSDPSISVLERSGWHETAPIGGPPGQEPFLNAAALLETPLPAQALWQRLREVEDRLGRRREIRWGPRVVDLDLLLYDRVTLLPQPSDAQSLQLPHPRMEFRRFVLTPAMEVASEMIHPPTGWSIGRLWRHLNEAPRSAALAGADPGARSALAERLRATFDGRSGDAAWTISDSWSTDRESTSVAGIPKLVIGMAPTDPRAAPDLASFAQDLRARRIGPLSIASGNDEKSAIEESIAALRAME